MDSVSQYNRSFNRHSICQSCNHRHKKQQQQQQQQQQKSDKNALSKLCCFYLRMIHFMFTCFELAKFRCQSRSCIGRNPRRNQSSITPSHNTINQSTPHTIGTIYVSQRRATRTSDIVWAASCSSGPAEAKTSGTISRYELYYTPTITPSSDTSC